MLEKFKSYGFWFVAAAAVLWSLDGVLRVGFRTPGSSIYMDTLNLVFWEHLLGFVVLLPFLVFRLKELKQISLKQWMAASAVALLASVLGLVFYTSALGLVFFVPFSIVILLQQLQPVWAIGSAKLLLKEHISLRFVSLAFVAFVGVYFISFPEFVPNLATGENTATAAVLAILASICWGLGTSLGKYFLQDISVVTGTGVRFGLATIFSLFLWLVAPILSGFVPFIPGYVLQTEALNLNWEQFQSLLLVVLVTGMGAMLVYYFGLKNTQAKLATIGELAWPASALLIGILGFGDLEKYTWSQLVGLFILVAAMFVLSKSEFAKPDQKQNSGQIDSLKQAKLEL